MVLTHLWAEVYGIIQKSERSDIEVEIWSTLISQALVAAKEKNARCVQFRLIEKPGSEQLSDKLPNLGFQKKQHRIEFRKNLSELPSGDGSMISWQSASEFGWQVRDVANFLKLVAKGDPDSEPTDDPVTYVQDWMKDPVLTCGTDCISVGFKDKKPCALMVAQINPKSKWSRISYMGIIPEFRRQGLGKWVHRKGFDMMRAKGGTLYHGGTSTENLAMLALFKSHRCEIYCKMQEWIWKPSAEVAP